MGARLKIVFAGCAAWFAPLVARAGTTTQDFLTQVGSKTNLGAAEPQALVGRLINVFLTLITALLVALLVYGGYLWMTARGNEDRVKDAKNTITNAMIGLVITLLAYAAARFLVRALAVATSMR